MNYAELAAILDKKPRTLANYFSRHGLSIKQAADIRLYLQRVQSGKRWEQGRRKAEHLKQFRFGQRKDKLQRARELVANRSLTWHTDPLKLSESAVVEYVFSYGDWNDFLELIRLLGKSHVGEIFVKQISKPRHNYRPQTKKLFQLYFSHA